MLEQTQMPLTSNSPTVTVEDSNTDSYNLALTIVEAASDRKGGNIVLLRVGDVSYLADYFVMVTGFSHVQVRAISHAIASQTEEELERLPLRVEGQTEGNWLLMDYGDVIVHIFTPRDREFYNLEAFWGHAERVDLSRFLTSN
jgi:ribosome-associated protein